MGPDCIFHCQCDSRIEAASYNKRLKSVLQQMKQK